MAFYSVRETSIRSLIASLILSKTNRNGVSRSGEGFSKQGVQILRLLPEPWELILTDEWAVSEDRCHHKSRGVGNYVVKIDDCFKK